MNEGAFRGVVLVAVAVVIGLILLGSGLDDTVGTARVDDDSSDAADSGGGGSDDDTGDSGDDSVSNPIDPSSINVVVANGAGVEGAAGNVSTQLAGLGYPAPVAVDTTVETTATPLDTVYYQTSPNTEAQARQVLTDLNLPESALVPYPGEAEAPAAIGLAQVLVVLGSSPGQLVTSGAAATTVPPG